MELTNDLASVHRAVYKARARWYNIGLQLRLEASTLDSIQCQFSGQPDVLGDCLRETLKRWLQRGQRLQLLFDALRSPTVGEERLALELERSNIHISSRGVPTRRRSTRIRRRKRSTRIPTRRRSTDNLTAGRKPFLNPGCVLLLLLLTLLSLRLVGYFYEHEDNDQPNASHPRAQSAPQNTEPEFAVEIPGTPSSSGESAQHNLPYLSGPFVGRESAVRQIITKLLLHTTKVKIGIVGIYGPPAVGKSTLAICVGHVMVKHGVAVRYINLNDAHLFRTQPDSNAFHHTPPSTQQASTDVSTYSDERTSLSMMWFSVTEGKYVTQTAKELVEWAKGLTNNTLLILDNCDDVLEESESLKNAFQNIILALHQSSYFLKVIITSRVKLTLIASFKPYELQELELSSAVELLQVETVS